MFSITVLGLCLFAVLTHAFVIPSAEQIRLLAQDALLESKEDLNDKQLDTNTPKRIGIIGSGITGAVTAFRLAEGYRATQPPDQQPEITVFERNPIVGGRITQTYAFNNPLFPIDTCADTFSIADQCIAGSVLDVGLSILPELDLRGGVGVWNGTNFEGFVEEGEFRNALLWPEYRRSKLYPRYGNIPTDFALNVTNIRLQFDLILPPPVPTIGLAPAPPMLGFANLSAQVEFAGLLGYDTNPVCAGGIPGYPNGSRADNFAREAVYPAARERYFGDGMDLNLLEYFLGYEEELPVSVQGGNLRLIERLIGLSKSEIKLNTDVQSIEKLPLDRLLLKGTQGLDGSPSPYEGVFDAIVMATSLDLSNITIEPALADSTPGLKQLYKDSFVTHFTTSGVLNAAMFNWTETMPQNIFTTISNDENDPPPQFFSLLLVKRLFNPDDPNNKAENLYKLTSREEISDEDILQLLRTPQDDETGLAPVISWIDRQPLPRSVPVTSTEDSLVCGERLLLESIEIMPGVYYAGGGEQIIASAEFGCRMGSNVANIIVAGVQEM